MLSAYKNWIFDWSGTLVDDMSLVIKATNHVMKQYGVEPFTRVSFRASFRLPYTEWYEEILPGVAIEEIEGFFRAGFKECHKEVPVLAHARDFLQKLESHGNRIFVCTSMDPRVFEIQMQGHGLEVFFEETYSGVVDKRSVIVDILENHSLHPDETIFVGDMTHDVETAHHGNIASLALLTGYNSSEELSAAKPTYLFEDLSLALGKW